MDLGTLRDNYMSLDEFNQLVEFIKKTHAWGVGGKWVKYIRPSYDFRTNKIFGLTLQGMFDDQEFYIVNQNVHRNLYDWVMEWLNSNNGKAVGV